MKHFLGILGGGLSQYQRHKNNSLSLHKTEIFLLALNIHYEAEGADVSLMAPMSNAVMSLSLASGTKYRRKII